MFKKNEGILKQTFGKMIYTVQTHKKYLERELEDTGVCPAQHRILMQLSDNTNISQREIADMMRVSTATIAVSIKKLEKCGCIEKNIDNEDNRFNQIKMTAKGENIVKDSIKLFDRLDKATFDGFTEKELVILNSYLDRITDNLQKFSLKGKDEK